VLSEPDRLGPVPAHQADILRRMGLELVIPGTLRDSLYILDRLLDQETSLRPTEVMTDSASYSDQVFGLFRLLGYQFSPRLADIGDARFWRLDRSARYGPLDEVARHRIDTQLIAAHWDDLLRVAGSLLEHGRYFFHAIRRRRPRRAPLSGLFGLDRSSVPILLGARAQPRQRGTQGWRLTRLRTFCTKTPLSASPPIVSPIRDAQSPAEQRRGLLRRSGDPGRSRPLRPKAAGDRSMRVDEKSCDGYRDRSWADGGREGP